MRDVISGVRNEPSVSQAYDKDLCESPRPALAKIASNCSIMTSLKECSHLSFFSLQLNEKRYGGGGEDSVAGSPPPGGGGGTADRGSLAGGAAGQG